MAENIGKKCTYISAGKYYSGTIIGIRNGNYVLDLHGYPWDVYYEEKNLIILYIIMDMCIRMNRNV